MLRVNGSIFFGAVEHVEEAFHRVDRDNPAQKHLLIVASGINLIDISGAELLAREARRRRALGGGLYFYFMKDAVREGGGAGGYLKDIGEENVFAQGADVIASLACPRLSAGVCRGCEARIFPPCPTLLPNGEAPPRALSRGRSATRRFLLFLEESASPPAFVSTASCVR